MPGTKSARRFSLAFEQFLELLDSFVRQRGHAGVLYSERVGNFPLGHRATYYRNRYRQGRLTAEQVRLLEDSQRFPAWTWHPLERRFAEGLRRLERFVSREGHAAVPAEYVEGRFRLGSWVSHRRHERRVGRLPEAHTRRLQCLPGWRWNPARQHFSEGMRHLRGFVRREGHARVPAGHVEGGFRLGIWVRHRRRDWRSGGLNARKARVLACLPGWTWDVRCEEFERAYSMLMLFVRREGHARVRQKHVEKGFLLGAWVARVRLRHRAASHGTLTRRQVRRLERLPGWTWGKPRLTPSKRSVRPSAQGHRRLALTEDRMRIRN